MRGWSRHKKVASSTTEYSFLSEDVKLLGSYTMQSRPEIAHQKFIAVTESPSTDVMCSCCQASGQQLTMVHGLFSSQSSEYLTGYPQLLTLGIKKLPARVHFSVSI